MADIDLFGNPVAPRDIPLPPGERKRKPTRPNGYAAQPGTGPAGKTCRTCVHCARIRHAKTYLKCLKLRDRWTNGPGTDIRAASPACIYFQPKEEK